MIFEWDVLGKMDHLRMFGYKLELQNNIAWIKSIVEIILFTLLNLLHEPVFILNELREFAFILFFY